MASNNFQQYATQTYRNKPSLPNKQANNKVTITLPKKEKIKDNKYHVLFNNWQYRW